jgi:hypothetical protein
VRRTLSSEKQRASAIIAPVLDRSRDVVRGLRHILSLDGRRDSKEYYCLAQNIVVKKLAEGDK